MRALQRVVAVAGVSGEVSLGAVRVAPSEAGGPREEEGGAGGGVRVVQQRGGQRGGGGGVDGRLEGEGRENHRGRGRGPAFGGGLFGAVVQAVQEDRAPVQPARAGVRRRGGLRVVRHRRPGRRRDRRQRPRRADLPSLRRRHRTRPAPGRRRRQTPQPPRSPPRAGPRDDDDDPRHRGHLSKKDCVVSFCVLHREGGTFSY
mmetsp:Transcript_38320/g.122886  ORF Transcript_38320/g.122886 Transcript_38320/m.122886 type:complete len:202 (+) Transcript_38320:54-659(+)